MTDYFIRFVNNLNPNREYDELLNWPTYNTTARAILQFLNGAAKRLKVGVDDERTAGMNELFKLGLRFPF